jgi:hypothetical protein
MFTEAIYLQEVLKRIHKEMSTENEEVVFTDQQVTLKFNSAIPYVRANCHGFLRTEQFRAMAYKVAETLAANNSEYPVINFLVDTTELLIVDYKDLEWAAKEGDVLFYQLGVRKLAFIVPLTKFEKFYLNTYQYHAVRDPKNQLLREQFRTEEEALAWLKEPVQEIS